MATFIHFLPLLFVVCVGIPIKPRPLQATDDCYGTDCYYYYDSDNTVEVNFPENLTEAILLSLPNILGSQNKMVALMNKTLISQDEVSDVVGQRLESMDVSLKDLGLINNKTLVSQNKLLETVDHRLESMDVSIEDLGLINNKTMISQDKLFDMVGHKLENIDTSLENLGMISNKTLISQDKLLGMVGHRLENIDTSLENLGMINNKTLISQDKLLDTVDHRLEDMDVSLQNLDLTNNKTLISQDKTVDILERLDASIGNINRHLEQEKHRLEDMDVSLKNLDLTNNKTLVSQDKTVDILERVEATLDSMDSHLEQEKLQTNAMIKIMGRVAKLLEQQSSTKYMTSTTPSLGVTSTELPPAKDCQDLADRRIDSSGTYVINPTDGLGPLEVYCDFIDTKGWTVFQRRYDGSVNFYRNWAEYENGFGDSNGEYWLGLKNIRRLIADGNTWVLRVDLESFDGESAYAVYDSFSISDAADDYRLSVGEYNGTAGDSLKNTARNGRWLHNGMQFSAYDRDNDVHPSSFNCAESFKGGFWYNACLSVNLNGKYLGRDGGGYEGVVWYTWKQWKSLKSSEMKIKRV